jgi:bla regulator protein blaR1
MQEDFINDLMQEGVIKNTKNLSYKLGREELIVNGVKQPDALHRKLKEKYLKEAGVELFYDWEGKRGIMYSR